MEAQLKTCTTQSQKCHKTLKRFCCAQLFQYALQLFHGYTIAFLLSLHCSKFKVTTPQYNKWQHICKAYWKAFPSKARKNAISWLSHKQVFERDKLKSFSKANHFSFSGVNWGETKKGDSYQGEQTARFFPYLLLSISCSTGLLSSSSIFLVWTPSSFFRCKIALCQM